LRAAEWQKLADLVSGSKWAEMDFLRRAFLSRAEERLGEEDDAAREWSDAVSTARGRGDALESLAKFALRMKWGKRAEEIMWMLAARPQGPRWVVDSLWKDAFQRGETARLQKLGTVLIQADPKGMAARNNYAFISLLTRNDEGNPHRIAEELHREYPDNAMVASTYALSLFQRGRAGEAAAIMAAQKPEDLRQPQVALYCAIFLLGDGQSEKAEEYLKLSADWPMLPEEKSLLDRVKAATLKKAEAATDPLHGGGAR
jgi:thioredoxin-like negative regulator of GroEL